MRLSGAPGCLLSAFVLLVSLMLTGWRPLIGGPLLVAAVLLCWWAAKRATATERAARLLQDERRERAAGPPIGDAWRRLLEADGLGDIVERLAGHTREALRLLTREDAELLRGGTRIGGGPDLPPSVAWPRYKDRPLAFLAQLDLAEIARQLPASPLPREGQLWFFCDAAGWDFSAPGSAVVLHANATELQPTPVPPDLPKSMRFNGCAVSFERYEDLPDLDGVGWLEQAIGKDEGRSEAYVETAEYLNLGAHTCTHKLLGYANAIQGRMEPECRPAAEDWRLLLQVDSDPNAGMMWGDAGRVYFWIRDEDLRAARFDRVCTVVQCY